MRKLNILALFAVLFVACSALHLVEPSAAATPKGYLIDHGTKYTEDIEGNPYKYTWETYWYSKNTRKIVVKNYNIEKSKFVLGETKVIIFKKVSKTKMKEKVTLYYGKEKKPYLDRIAYVNTKLNTRNFYWKVVRPDIDDYLPF